MILNNVIRLSRLLPLLLLQLGCQTSGLEPALLTTTPSALLPRVEEGLGHALTEAHETTPSSVMNVSYQADTEELPAPPPSARRNFGMVQQQEPNSLHLSEVVESVQTSYPLLLSAMAEGQIADGKQLAAWGDFDLNVKAYSVAAPEGFYQNYRNVVSAEQPLFDGGYLYSGYKLGRGNFQPWYGERESDDGGEFSIGLGTPLLKGR